MKICLEYIHSLDERRKHLFNRYIERMFDRRQSSQKQRYTKDQSKDQSKQWLVVLAQRMMQESQTVFLIERIQPSWLLVETQKWIYRIGFILTVGIAINLSYYLIFNCINELIYLLINKSDFIKMNSFLNSGIFTITLIIGVIELISSLLRNREEIKPFETITLNRKNILNSFKNGTKRGIIIGIIIGIGSFSWSESSFNNKYTYNNETP